MPKVQDRHHHNNHQHHVRIPDRCLSFQVVVILAMLVLLSIMDGRTIMVVEAVPTSIVLNIKIYKNEYDTNYYYVAPALFGPLFPSQ